MVRNRKTYFIELLEEKAGSNEILNELNVAFGPARDLYEFYQRKFENVFVDCVEYDQKAIDFAKDLYNASQHSINFHKANAFRFKTTKKYELIWSAGLFDYFNDERFVFLLKRLINFIAPNGELVIGNFSDKNPTRSYMEILDDWILRHRSEQQLASAAKESGAKADSIFIGKEPEGVNLFLHVKN